MKSLHLFLICRQKRKRQKAEGTQQGNCVAHPEQDRKGKTNRDSTVRLFRKRDAKPNKGITDAGGKAVIEWNKAIRSYVARKGTDTAMLPQSIYLNRYYERGESGPAEHITLLTDRSLYRPGQTVYVKGISYEQAADTAHVLAGKNYLVRLLDVNRKELVQKSVDTNEFGSFTTEFVLPAVCLNGNFMVEVKDKAAVPVRVEDYKRPTFEIVFNPVEQAYSLGDTVSITGNVKAYNGNRLPRLSQIQCNWMLKATSPFLLS